MRSKKPVLAGIVGALVVWQTLALNPFHVSAKNETGDHPASQILPGTITRQHGKGLYAIVFSVAAGAITVNVPDDIEAGDTVSINLKEQMAQGLAPAAQATVRKRLDAYTIVFADQTISAGKSFSKVTIPGVVPTGFLPLILSLNKQEVLRTYVECAPRSHLPVGGAALSGGKQNPTFQLPQAIQAGRSMQIFGNFNGDMSDTHVRFTADPHEPRSRSDNLSRRWLSSVGSRWAFGSETSHAPTASKELDLLAESPRMLVCQSPTDIIGPVEVEISEAGRTIKARSRNVSLNLSAARTSLEKGQSTELEIDIDGLQEITEPLNFTLDNVSSAVISMSGGVNQVVAISPAVVSTGGRFHTSRTLTAIQAGGFTINATIVVNAFFLAGFFSCDDCNATCKAAPNCERGKFKDGPQEPYRGPVKTSTGDLWMQFRYQVYECNLHVCRVLGIACCEYNSWDEKGYAYKWKVSKKNPATGGPQIGANGDVVYEDSPPAVPCDCGGLIDIATAIGLAGGIDRPSEFKKAAADRCPGLSAEAASAMATKCGLADMWDTAMKGSAADWSEYAQKWLRLFGGSTPSIPRTP